jgi:hypothetical protein
MATLERRPIADTRWSVQRPNGVAMQLEVVANNASYTPDLVRQHAHR